MDVTGPKNNFFYAWIYVEVELEEGLPSEIKLNLNGWVTFKHQIMINFHSNDVFPMNMDTLPKIIRKKKRKNQLH